MEQVILELTPPSLENTPPVVVSIEIDEQQENPGQVVVNPLRKMLCYVKVLNEM